MVEQSQTSNITLTDAGTETHMIFLLKRPLNNFALFECLKTDEDKKLLTQMYETYLKVGQDYGCKMLIGSPTWRASAKHMKGMGYEDADVEKYNKLGVEFMRNFRETHPGVELTISGDVGPAGDGYVPDKLMTCEEARDLHAANVGGLAKGGAELIKAETMNYYEEATGVVLAAKAVNLPVIVDFTVETDGKLAGGMTFAEAIKKVDEATDGYTKHFGINCAHPNHCESSFAGLDADLLARVKQLRVNASKKSHAELDECEELDAGDKNELSAEVAQLVGKYNLTVIGGCCGTDNTHIEAMAEKLLKN